MILINNESSTNKGCLCECAYRLMALMASTDIILNSLRRLGKKRPAESSASNMCASLMRKNERLSLLSNNFTKISIISLFWEFFTLNQQTSNLSHDKIAFIYLFGAKIKLISNFKRPQNSLLLMCFLFIRPKFCF